jgi:cyclase
MSISRREILRVAAFGAGAMVLGPLATRRANAAITMDDEMQGQQEPVVTELVPGLFMIAGLGGNIGLFGGDEGKVVIDTGIPPSGPSALKLAQERGGSKPIVHVINTHHHGDHTGGNEVFAKAGVGIHSHDNCRARLSTELKNEFFNRTTPPAPEIARPKSTFSDTLTMRINGEEIRMSYVPPAHTDNDIILHFVNANVIHTGDLFFNGTYPFFDYSAGGNILGMIKAAEIILSKADDNTKIIPGHGNLAKKADLETNRAMMADIVSVIEPMVRAGKSESEVVAAKPTAKYDEKYGKGFINPENMVKLVYRTLPKA